MSQLTQWPDTSRSVLVCGSPRSGTSAMSWALNAHTEFFTGPESDFVWHLYGGGKLFKSYRAAYDRADGGWLRTNDVIFPEFCRAIGIGVDRVFMCRSSKPRWVDSTPSHILMGIELAYMLPNARFVHMARDGRAVVASMLQSGFDEEWSTSFEAACSTWAHYVTAGLELQAAFPQRVITVKHHDLVRDPYAECSRILRFLDAEDEPGPAEFIAGTRINSSFAAQGPAQVETISTATRKELVKAPAPRWSAAEQRLFWAVAGEAMAALGLPETNGSDDSAVTRSTVRGRK